MCKVLKKSVRWKNLSYTSLTELEGMYNPTLREKMGKSIVSKLIGTKMKLEWVLKKIKHDKFSGRITQTHKKKIKKKKNENK